MTYLLEKKNRALKSDKVDRLQQLERTVLELGTELFRMKTDVNSLRGFNSNFVEIMKGLQHILDEKGLISLEDFEGSKTSADWGEVTYQRSLKEILEKQ